MTEHPRIVIDPDILVGKPVIRGTRLSVEFVIGLLAAEWTEHDILDMLMSEKVYLSPSEHASVSG